MDTLLGLENAKWSEAVTSEHNVTLPFTRMIAGPMDFTPGAMDNAHRDDFEMRFNNPMSLGTRCHQVAMYVVYTSPLQMLCDSPSKYLKDPDCTRFIAKMPTTWDETVVLDASPGEYIVIARRHAKQWYLAAMTNDHSREFEVKLSMLGAGKWHLESIRDGSMAEMEAIDYEISRREVSRETTLNLKLASDGGWAGILHQQEP